MAGTRAGALAQEDDEDEDEDEDEDDGDGLEPADGDDAADEDDETGDDADTEDDEGNADEDEEDDEEDDEGPPDGFEAIEFAGEGVAISDEFEIETGMVVVEGDYDGDDSIFVQAVPADDGREFAFVGDADGFVSGAILDEGAYNLYVDAEGSWELTVLQPTSDEDGEEVPLSVDGDGADWIGPVEIEDGTSVRGSHGGQSAFHVEAFFREVEASELVFHAIGEFEGETTLYTDGVGYVVVDGDGDWELAFE